MDDLRITCAGVCDGLQRYCTACGSYHGDLTTSTIVSVPQEITKEPK